MAKSIADYIKKVSEKIDLSEEDAKDAFSLLTSGQASDIQIAAFLVALKVKGETIDEITGAAEALIQKSTKIKAPEVTIDTCGTGGDNSSSLNISTVVALVLSACGVAVAKHGNRAISSKSGSADVLSQFGVDLSVDNIIVQQCLDELGICFMMAPNFHPSMKHVGPVRAALGIRTIFNILGPLINPASVNYQLLGVYKKELVEPMANVLKKLGLTRAWVVCGNDGMDELSITGPTFVAELNNNEINTFEVSPADADLKNYRLEDIRGQDSAYNAKEMEKLLTGQGADAYREVVLLNAAAGLVIVGKASDLKHGVEIASKVLDDGTVDKQMIRLVEKTS